MLAVNRIIGPLAWKLLVNRKIGNLEYWNEPYRANCGAKLNWVPTQERFEFWKTVRRQIADPMNPIRLDRFPNETAYTASEWRGRAGERLVLLETHH